MGKLQRNKGYRGERNLVNLLKQNGLNVYRVPLSGGSSIKGDIVIEDRYKCEVKVRKDGFKLIYKYLGDNDILFIKADRRPYIACLDVSLLIKLLKEGIF